MSTSNPNSTAGGAGATLTLPSGWQIAAGRETGQTTPNGQVTQGIAYTLTSPGGTTTTVFIPYSMIGNIAQVQGLINARTAAIQAIEGSA